MYPASMKTYDSNKRIKQLEAILEPLRMANCQPMQRLAKEGIDLATARTIAKGYLAANMASPQIMAAAFINIEDEAFRMSLLSNLWEECGSGVPSQSHIQLFKRFVYAVGLNPDDYVKPIPGSTTAELISTYLEVCQQGPGYRGLAILYAFEDIFAYCNELLSQGFRVSKIVTEYEAEFFSLHAVADIEHAARLRATMFEAAANDYEWQVCLHLVRRGGQLLHDMFKEFALDNSTQYILEEQSCETPTWRYYRPVAYSIYAE